MPHFHAAVAVGGFIVVPVSATEVDDDYDHDEDEDAGRANKH